MTGEQAALLLAAWGIGAVMGSAGLYLVFRWWRL